MRLICANCAAQYEIAATAIPPAGREVKCSACGHVWHQAPPPAFGDALPLSRRPVDAEALRILREEAAREAEVRAKAALAATQAAEADRTDAPAEAEAAPALEPAAASSLSRSDTPPEPEPRFGSESRVVADTAFDPEPTSEPGTPVASDSPPESLPLYGDDAPPEAPEAPEAHGGVIAPAPAAIADARVASEPAGLADALVSSEPAGIAEMRAPPEAARLTEALPDPAPLAEPATAAAQPRVDRAIADVMPVAAVAAVSATPAASAPPAEVPAQTPPSAAAPVAAAGKPARPLPDPKLAQSTLGPVAQPRGGRFGVGFVLGLIVVAALAGLYVVAPGLAEDAPAAAPYLGAYVEAVDAARLWLDGVTRPVLDRLRP